ncbi:SAM hydrolase/SAM-dependent halogenase family protein [Rhodovibrionaceae bacterium A322]
MTQLVLFTDFGSQGPYQGQMKSRLYAVAPNLVLIDLMNDAPAYNARASAYLLEAYAPYFPEDAVFLAVVDPGVGTSRNAVVLSAGGQRFVGPDNGLLARVARRGQLLGSELTLSQIHWQPTRLSASFHGRDLFAPVAAALASGQPLPGGSDAIRDLLLDDLQGFTDRQRFPDQLPEVIYLDPYGNAVTGLTAARLPKDWYLQIGDRTIAKARTFGEVPAGQAFCYENANGLVEIAVNQGSAARDLGLHIGQPLALCDC